MPNRKSRGNSNFMKSIQRPIVWAVAILFGVGIVWWSVAQYLGGSSQGNEQGTGTEISFTETVGGLTKDGTLSQIQITGSLIQNTKRLCATHLRIFGVRVTTSIHTLKLKTIPVKWESDMICSSH